MGQSVRDARAPSQAAAFPLGTLGASPAAPLRGPTMRRLVPLLLLALLTACPSEKGYSLRLHNETGVELVPYVVVTAPGQPPARQADPANALPSGAFAEIDVDGFNPLYYSAARGHGLLLQMALDDEPPSLLARLLDYPAAPDALSSGQQPTLIVEQAFEPPAKTITLTVGGAAPPADPFSFSAQ